MVELVEVVKSIRNRCDVIQLLWDTPGYLHLIPTVLEDLYEDAQDAVNEFCVEDDDKPT